MHGVNILEHVDGQDSQTHAEEEELVEEEEEEEADDVEEDEELAKTDIDIEDQQLNNEVRPIDENEEFHFEIGLFWCFGFFCFCFLSWGWRASSPRQQLGEKNPLPPFHK